MSVQAKQSLVQALNNPGTTEWRVATNATQEAFATVLSGNDRISGGAMADLLRGYGAAADRRRGRRQPVWRPRRRYDLRQRWAHCATPTFLRGEDGADTITGGASFDDMHGNSGNDVLYGRAGGDWVAGGKDDDRLYG